MIDPTEMSPLTTPVNQSQRARLESKGFVIPPNITNNFEDVNNQTSRSLITFSENNLDRKTVESTDKMTTE